MTSKKGQGAAIQKIQEDAGICDTYRGVFREFIRRFFGFQGMNDVENINPTSD